jgi:hypothetical protein
MEQMSATEDFGRQYSTTKRSCPSTVTLGELANSAKRDTVDRREIYGLQFGAAFIWARNHFDGGDAGVV